MTWAGDSVRFPGFFLSVPSLSVAPTSSFFVARLNFFCLKGDGGRTVVKSFFSGLTRTLSLPSFLHLF